MRYLFRRYLSETDTMTFSARLLAAASVLIFAPALAQAQQVDVGAPAPAAPTPDTDTADTQHRPRTDIHANRDTSPSALIGNTQSSPPPGLIGDWQEIRTRLGERGIGLTARYASESGYNVAGGDRKLFRETGQFDVGALLDLDKLVGLKGGAFQATVTWRRGYDLTTDAGLNTLQQVQEVYGRGQTVRVTQLWYEQKIGERVEVKLGRTNPGEDFAVFSCHFQNLSFCGAPPGNLNGDYWYNWPIGQWGARVHVDLPRDFYVQGAVYEINPRNLDNGFFVAHFKGATGVLIPVEAGWSRGGNDGHVGSYKVGGWIGTADGDDILLDVNRRPIAITGLSPLQHKSRYGVYFSMQQQLTGTSKDGKAATGLSMFANFTQSDRATTLTDNQVALGLFYKGLVPAVPGDVLGVAVARTNVNSRAEQADRIAGVSPRDAEYAAEVYYSIHPADWLELRPNVQWVHQPGGVRNAKNVGVLGMKAAVTL
jgi:porin